MAFCNSWAGKGGVCKVSVGPLISQSLGYPSIPGLWRTWRLGTHSLGPSGGWENGRRWGWRGDGRHP